ncbi:DUF1194 domain-containing protein [Actibacterium sp. D379-3]
MRGTRFALMLALLAPDPALADPACRQALAIGLDVSGSVDAREYQLQLDGLAAALLSPEVSAALLQMPQAPAALSVYEWSGARDQRQILPWTRIDSTRALADAARALRQVERRLQSPETALGAAMMQGGALLAGMPGCWTRTLDISGDGESNEGPRPRDVGDDPRFADITINALVVGSAGQDEAAALTAYFRAEVIRGPGAFVEVALGFEDYQAAMTRKLLRELSGLNVARLAPQ